MRFYSDTGMTLQWVAERVGYSISGISLILSGGRNPTLEWMRLIETRFDWPVEDQVIDLENYKNRLKAVLEFRYLQHHAGDSTGYKCPECGRWAMGVLPCKECRLDAASIKGVR